MNPEPATREQVLAWCERMDSLLNSIRAQGRQEFQAEVAMRVALMTAILVFALTQGITP